MASGKNQKMPRIRDVTLGPYDTVLLHPSTRILGMLPISFSSPSILYRSILFSPKEKEEYTPMPNCRPNKRGRIGAFPALFFLFRFSPTAGSSIEGSTYSHGELEPDTLYEDSHL